MLSHVRRFSAAPLHRRRLFFLGRFYYLHFVMAFFYTYIIIMNQSALHSGAWQLLSQNRLAVLATASATGIPEAALVYYVVDQDLSIYCATFKESRKIHNIQENPQVALVIGQEVNAVVLQLEGKAHIIQENNLRGNVLAKLSAVGNENPQSLNFPPLLVLSEKSIMEFIHITIDWFKYSQFESDITTIAEGKPGDWEERNLREQ